MINFCELPFARTDTETGLLLLSRKIAIDMVSWLLTVYFRFFFKVRIRNNLVTLETLKILRHNNETNESSLCLRVILSVFF